MEAIVIVLFSGQSTRSIFASSRSSFRSHCSCRSRFRQRASRRHGDGDERRQRRHAHDRHEWHGPLRSPAADAGDLFAWQTRL